MISTVVYSGGLRTAATHIASGNTIITDAPVDNHGKGEAFSPTDLVATALASCMCTVMGISANTHGINIDGTSCEVEKIMAADPRRIGEIKISLSFPASVSYSAKEKTLMERAALTCPVHHSLHPDLKKSIRFIWPGTDDL